MHKSRPQPPPPSPPKQQQQRRRRRPALACRECRRRKIKCDRNDPCAHCAIHKTHCVFNPYGHVIESSPVTGTNILVHHPAQLPPGQFELPSALSGLSMPTPSSDSRDSASAGSASLQQHKQPQEPLEQPPQPIDPPVLGRKESIPDTVTAVQSIPDMKTSDSTNRNSTQHPSSSLPQHTIGPSSLAVFGSHVDDLLQRVQRLEEFRSTFSWTGDSLNSLSSSLPARMKTSWDDPLVRHTDSRSQVRPQEWQVVLNKPRDLGRNRPMGAAPEFAAIISSYSAILGKRSEGFPAHDPEIEALRAQAGDLLLKCKNIARRLKANRPSQILPQVCAELRLGVHLVPPSRTAAEAMAKLYFQCFESTHRILHIPTFWADYQEYWDHPHTVTDDLRIKVLLVIAIGSSLYDHGDSSAVIVNMGMVRPWIYAAEAWLAGPLEKDRLDIGGLQIYCLSVIARQIFSIGGDLVWISTGSLMHRAMQIGLHRDPKHLPSVSLLHSEVRRRLWATILDLVVQCSLDAWMPPRISFDEFDTEPPSNVNDDVLVESTLEIVPHPRTTFTTTSTQLALLDSLPIRLRIVQLLNGLNSELSYPGVLAISSELTAALQTCSNLGTMKATDGQDYSHAMKNDQDAAPRSTPFHRNLLDYLVRRFMIPLHYSFSNEARSNPLFHYSLKTSLDAALALISPEPDAGGSFARLMATGGGLFREGLRCAITAISLELLTHVGAQQQNGTLHRATQHRELIKRAVRDLIALSEERIRYGETNVKSHMFLSMILAQVEAVEAGVGIELAIAKSATDSLRFCHEILSGRAGASLPVNESDSFGAVEDMNGSTPGSMSFEDYGTGWNWETFLPNTGFS